MTQITEFKQEGPHNDEGIPITAATVLAWEQTKVIVDELNAREPERMETFRHELSIVEREVGRRDNIPPGLDTGALIVLVGAIAGLIRSMPGDHQPDTTGIVLRLLMSALVPDHLGGAMLAATACSMMKPKNAAIVALEGEVEAQERIAEAKAKREGSADKEPDDNTKDQINRVLEGLRKGSLN